MTRRTGATLVEVLVTIFVMALGLITLLTLFPLGALRMAEAIKDSRTANAAANADAIATARTFRNDGSLVNLYQQPGGVTAAPNDGPSYPVYMDPIGFRSYSGLPIQLRNWVGAVNGLGIRRVEPRFITQIPPDPVPSDQQIRRTLSSFALLDDITFGPNGVPIGPDGNPSGGNNFVQREGRYTWAYLFKRPKTATPSVVDMTVVVYSGRPQQLNSGLTTGFGETRYDAAEGTEGGNTLTVTWSGGAGRPNIKNGTWILDATSYDLRDPKLGGVGPILRLLALRHGPVHGFFYRVVKVTSESSGRMTLQLATPLKAEIGIKVGGPAYRPQIIVMEYVSEVFEKGPGWLP